MLLPLILFALVAAWAVGFLFHTGVRQNRYLLIAAGVIAVSAVYLTFGQVSERFGQLPSFRDCPDCPGMVLIPRDRFIMGSPDSEAGRQNGETRQAVLIPRGFAVGRHAVTFREWGICVADGGCGGYAPADEGFGRDDRPVINVSWNDATAYAAWLSKKTGKAYRLLSEAEREYVTRAGVYAPFWWGAAISTGEANYDGSRVYGGGKAGLNRQKTLPVKSFEENPWGLYQVHGNVWEWTGDCWNGNHDSNPGDGAAATTGDCGRRVLKGGAWNSDPAELRSASRLGAAADARTSSYGFRVARDLER
jgi:formylglycine-generating enzyme required for sulfatase activity